MPNLAERMMRRLLALVPWYRPDEIAAREERTERAHRKSIAARMDAEHAIAGRSPRLDSYRRVRF